MTDHTLTDAASIRLIKNGAAVMIVALFGGFVLDFALLGAVSFSPAPISIPVEIPGTAQGWRAVHVGTLMNGIMAVALGLAMRRFALTARDAAVVSWGTIIAVWGNTGFYIFGMFAPNHGLTLASNRLGEANWAGVIAFAPAIVGAVTLLWALAVLVMAKPTGPRA